MTKHSFILSSAGLINIILSSEYRKINQDPLDEELDQFSFIIGQKEIKMNRFFLQNFYHQEFHISIVQIQL